MSSELIKSKALKDVVQRDEVKNRLKEIMGSRAPQFAAALVQTVNQSSQLQKCDANSVIGAAITAAALDLSIDPNIGEAHIVPYGEKATFQIGYKGFIQLAMRSGEYKSMGSVVVYDGELTVWDKLTGELVVEKSKRKPDARIIGYAAKFKLINGFERGEFWTCEEIESHASQYSKAYRYAKGDKRKEESCLWVTKRDEMALKTVEKSLLSHYGPKSIQMRKALKMDGGAVIDADVETVSYVDNEPLVVEPSRPVFSTTVVSSNQAGKSVTGEILELLTKAEIKEVELVDFLIAVGTIDDDIRTLDEIRMRAPDALAMVIEQHEDIFNKIKEAR